MVVKIKPYCYPTVQKCEMERWIQKMLQVGIIRDSCNLFPSPTVMVKKKDGGWHLYVDYKQLNKYTIKDKSPITVIKELLDELGYATYFSKLDLWSDKDIHKAAFKTHEGHYEFLVMPFGLTNVPSNFQALMNVFFKPLPRKSILSWSSHMSHIKEVLQLLKEDKLYSKKAKCNFGTTEIKYLGHIILRGGLLTWRTTTSVKEIKGFLSLSSYYMRFIRHYDTLARPLTANRRRM
ncbi:reverse transcriptase [Gossypium australe]|uniref:Reverse transcriptase n=1 Tax=Gossypium australe TaxID=47621 RepID=A0A5B6WV78_9ROSI|nr:reverse transcriptase [Gossypium australe]